MLDRSNFKAIDEELRWHDELLQMIRDASNPNTPRKGIDIRAARGDGCMPGILSTERFAPHFLERILCALDGLRQDSARRLHHMGFDTLAKKEAAE